MIDPLDALTAQHAALDELLASLDDQGWASPSRCEGWDVADVVLHLVQTDELALASVAGTFREGLEQMVVGLEPASDIDDGAGLLVARDRGIAPDVLFRRWQHTAANLRSSFAGIDPATRLQWVAGTLAARTLITTRLTEAWIHTEDIAVPLGMPHDAGNRLWLVTRLAWRTIPYAFARSDETLHGSVVFQLTAPDGSTWEFPGSTEPPESSDRVTVVTGPAIDLCRVAGQRLDASSSALEAAGPDADRVLALIRTFA